MLWRYSYNWNKNQKDKFPVTDINLKNYSYEYYPNESSAGSTRLYIGNHLSYKPRNDLCIYRTAELESTFFKLINTKKSNVIIGAIHRHRNMDLNEFNDIYLNLLLHKISKKTKSIFLIVDFNVYLLKYDHHTPANECLDLVCCHMLLPHIIQSTRVTSSSKTVIENIFSNIAGPDFVSRNLIATVFDHLSQSV